MADDPKSTLALLNGIARRNYYGDKDITDSFLKDEIYPDLPEDQFSQLLSRCSSLLKSMVSADMDMTQLEAFITAQMKRKEGALSETQANVFRKFWKTNKTKVHDSIVAHTTWGNSLQKVSWRIDLKSQARHIDEINTPSAIMELHVSDGQNIEKTGDVVRFEMDEDHLSSVLQSMQEIEQEIAKNSQQ
ncbi:COMM domain-containing protein 1-like [Haliotis rufescens]|uniref:COMM domain-containing protein 1-like n=1 Tax=Haliotis rufescens TaxID=6454 RepID=UPI001EB09C35|nr:COMM domain-containing protein 1-like [Haliotis rufescens]